jgi:hypothetical protein
VLQVVENYANVNSHPLGNMINTGLKTHDTNKETIVLSNDAISY